MHLRFALVAVGAILCFMDAAFAQDPRGSIRGRVVDSSSAFVPGVSVSAVNAATGICAAAQTNQEVHLETGLELPEYRQRRQPQLYH
jgi:hypothetical protein